MRVDRRCPETPLDWTIYSRFEYPTLRACHLAFRPTADHLALTVTPAAATQEQGSSGDFDGAKRSDRPSLGSQITVIDIPTRIAVAAVS